MGWMDYALLALMAAVVFLAIRHIVKRGRAGCCAGCSGECARCAEARQEQKPNKLL